MKYFYALVHKDPGSAFGVQFPDLPGCFSAADTLDELVPNAADALKLWFDDTDLIEPSSIEDISAAVQDDLKQGAFIIAVPWIDLGGKNVRVNISIDQAILDAIDTRAGELNVTRSAFIAAAAQTLMFRSHR